jgi:hypothetical protein
MKRNKNKKNYYERNISPKFIKPILVAYIPYIEDQVQLKNVETDLTSKLAGQYHVLVVSIPIQTVAFEVLNPNIEIDVTTLTNIKDYISDKIQLIIDSKPGTKNGEKKNEKKSVLKKVDTITDNKTSK